MPASKFYFIVPAILSLFAANFFPAVFRFCRRARCTRRFALPELNDIFNLIRPIRLDLPQFIARAVALSRIKAVIAPQAAVCVAAASSRSKYMCRYKYESSLHV
jgi:hypothetical protein